MDTRKNTKTSALILLFSFTYFISYVTRTNYATIVSEMVTSLNQPKSALAVALTGSFITYGVGQLVSGFFGDRFQPKHLVAVGLVMTCCMNVLIPLCGNTTQMAIVWCINGFAQSFMWPPLVKLMATMLSEADYNRGCVRVSWGGSLGTMFVYLVGPLLITLAGWKSVFFMSAVLGILGLLLWWKKCPEIDMTATPKKNAETTGKTRLFSPLLVMALIGIILQGTLRDGVTTWMPSYIAEEFHFSNEIAILVGVILPLFSIVCHQFTELLYEKKLNNMFLCAAVMFGAGALAALGLYGFAGKNAALSVAMSAVLAGSMHGVNLLLVCLLPPVIAKGGKVSTISGIMNSCTYIGSALSTYVIPLAAEQAGWSVTLLLWLGIAATGALVCGICIPFWKKLA